jgi:hypothetical protein
MSQSPDAKPAKANRFAVPLEVLLLVASGALAFAMYIGYFRQ